MKQQIKKFEDLRIWQDSHLLTIEIYNSIKEHSGVHRR